MTLCRTSITLRSGGDQLDSIGENMATGTTFFRGSFCSNVKLLIHAVEGVEDSIAVKQDKVVSRRPEQGNLEVSDWSSHKEVE